MTKSGAIGAIGGTELPPVKRSFAAYAAGARSAKPGIRVVVSYVGNWDDVSAGKEQALAQINRKSDVLFQNADAAGLGVFQAAASRGPRTSSARTRTRTQLRGGDARQRGDRLDGTLPARRQRNQGTPVRPRVVSLGIRENVVRLVLNPTLQSRISAP
jgi:hypothetical protein